MVLHHFLSIVGNTVLLFWGVSGTEMIAAIFGSELTNPFLQIRWFLRQTDHHLTWYGELNDATFMLLFGYLRILVGTPLLYAHLTHPRTRPLVRFGGVLHYMVGWAFWFMIVRYAIRKYTKMYKKRESLKGSGKRATLEANIADEDCKESGKLELNGNMLGHFTNGVIQSKEKVN